MVMMNNFWADISAFRSQSFFQMQKKDFHSNRLDSTIQIKKIIRIESSRAAIYIKKQMTFLKLNK